MDQDGFGAVGTGTADTSDSAWAARRRRDDKLGVEGREAGCRCKSGRVAASLGQSPVAGRAGESDALRVVLGLGVGSLSGV
jgi:hypothetical protein